MTAYPSLPALIRRVRAEVGRVLWAGCFTCLLGAFVSGACLFAIGAGLV